MTLDHSRLGPARAPAANDATPAVSFQSARLGRSGDLVLLRCDADLRAALNPADVRLAERATLARGFAVEDESWLPPADAPEPGLAILIDGTIIQEVSLGDRSSAQLLGPGAILHDLSDHSSLAGQMTWTSVGPSTVAVLDERFTTAARYWPALWTVIHRRLVDQLKTAARWNAVTSMPRAEDRVLAVFWLIADRWGIRCPDGISIRMALTHDLIGRMAAARRPTTSLALATLAAEGLLTCRSGRRDWLLAPDSQRLLGADEPGNRAVRRLDVA